MKLHNTKNQMVRIRLPRQRVHLELGPNETVEIDMRTRHAISPYVSPFALKLEAEEADHHPDTRFINSTVNPTEKGQVQLHARQPGDGDEPTNEEMEGLFFKKAVENTEQTTSEEFGTATESAPGDDNLLGDADGLAELWETKQEKIESEEEMAGVPENCPYTKSELTTMVKSQLFEICEKLGLEAEGTKLNLIGRVLDFYGQK